MLHCTDLVNDWSDPAQVARQEQHYLYELYEFCESVATRLMSTEHDMFGPEHCEESESGAGLMTRMLFTTGHD